MQQADIGFKAFSSRTMKETLRSFIGERKHSVKSLSPKDSVKEALSKTKKTVFNPAPFEWLIKKDMTP